MSFLDKSEMVTREQALPGRQQKVAVPAAHVVTGNPLQEPFPPHLSRIVLGMGCFWGAEQRSGSLQECIQPLLAMPAATQITPSTRKCAVVRLVTAR